MPSHLSKACEMQVCLSRGTPRAGPRQYRTRRSSQMRSLWSFARIRLDALVASRSSYIRLKARADRLRGSPVERPEPLPSTAAPSYSSEFMHIHRSVAVAAVQYASLASRYDPCSVRNLWSAAATASRAPSRSAGLTDPTAEKSGPVQSVRN